MRTRNQVSHWRLFVIVLGLSISGVLWGAAEDDYLSAIEAESGKVDTSYAGAGSDSADEVKPSEGDDLSVDSDVREEFEQILDEKFHGSYVFYKKLPERSRQEIVQEYQRGTPFVKIRKKIIDRFMQR